MYSRKLVVFIDLDDTLIHAGGSRKNYQLSRGGAEFLSVLERIPGVKVNFFSAGSEKRNVELLETVMAERFENESDAPLYSVYSREDTKVGSKRTRNEDTKVAIGSKRTRNEDTKVGSKRTRNEHTKVAIGSKRTRNEDTKVHKKLDGLFSGLNLDYAIMVDDRSHAYAAEGEERNFLHIISFWRDAIRMTSYNDVIAAPTRLVRALGMLLWAVHLSKLRGWTPVEALTAMQWYGGKGYRHSQTHSKSIYDLGLAAMKKVNPSFTEVYIPFDLPFEFTFPNNLFTSEQLSRITSKLPNVVNEDELTPPKGFNPELIMRRYSGDVVVEFPALPEEPRAGVSGTCSVAVRFPNGSRGQRRYFMHDKLACVWAYCRENVQEAAKGRKFTLKTPYAYGATIEYDPNITLVEANIMNILLIIAWVVD